MQVYLLKPGDDKLHIEAVQALNDCTIPLERSAALLSEPTYVFVIAVDESNEVMGRVYGYVLHRFEQTDLLLYEVDVVDRHQRKGVGRAMLEFLHGVCEERGYAEMWVLTEEDNVAGRALYSKSGGKLDDSDVRMYVFNTK
jgi:GNAT superfamily N-acetyltransferase